MNATSQPDEERAMPPRRRWFGSGAAPGNCAQHLVFVACLFGSIASVVLYVLPLSPSGALVLTPAVQNLGDVRQGTTTTAEFRLENHHSGAIRIVDVGTSCGCTTSQLSDESIAKGASAKLTLTYNSRMARGQINVQAVVLYRQASSQDVRSVVARATGSIDPDYTITPERLEFNSAGPSTQRIVLEPRHIDTLNVNSVSCDKRFFRASVVPSAESDQSVVEVGFDPAEYYADAGPAHVEIKTDSAVQPVAHIPIEVRQPNGYSPLSMR